MIVVMKLLIHSCKRLLKVKKAICSYKTGLDYGVSHRDCIFRFFAIQVNSSHIRELFSREMCEVLLKIIAAIFNCPWHILCRQQCSMYALFEQKICVQMWFGKRNVFLSMFLTTDAERGTEVNCKTWRDVTKGIVNKTDFRWKISQAWWRMCDVSGWNKKKKRD
jgi:hypothetical protein